MDDEQVSVRRYICIENLTPSIKLKQFSHSQENSTYHE
jgi:hypothetical protein